MRYLLGAFFLGSEGIVLAGTTSAIDPVMGATRYLIFLISAFLVVAYWKTIFSMVSENLITCLLSSVAMGSLFWSISPYLTLLPVTRLFGWSLFGAYFSARYTLQGQLKILSSAMLLILLTSIVFVLALPSAGIEAGIHLGAWRGIFWHKNSLGFFMSLASCFFLLTSIETKGVEKIFWLACTLLATVLLLFSKSTSALAILVITLLAFLLYRTVRLESRAFAAIFCAILLLSGSVLSWLQGNFESVVTALGKDPTLSGRTDIWLAVIKKIYERPFLGTGLAAFWDKAGPAADVWKEVGWLAPKSHNGFIDLGAELGLVGIALFIASFLLTFQRALQWAKVGRESYSFWPLLYLTIFLLYNQTEGPIIAGTFTWILYLSLSLSLQAALKERRHFIQQGQTF